MNFSHYWQHADSLSHLLYVVLVVLSVLTWSLWTIKALAAKRLRQHAQQQLSQAIAPVIQQVASLSVEQQKWAVEQALLQAIAQQKAQAEKGIAVLGTIASIAPFIGLFGTVWGIFHALIAVGQSGQAGLAQVATPVGEALIMTGLGLAVAIPAVLAYNFCVRQNRLLNHDLHDYAHHLLIEQLLKPTL